MRTKFKKIIFVAPVLTLLFAAQTAAAAEFIKPNDSGNTIISGDGHRNVYAAGGNITVTGNIAGDLMAGGGNVVVQGNVEDDLMAGGGTLVINGTVGGDARLGGGNVTITGPVRGDVLVGGGNVTIAKTAEISGDLVVGSGNIVIEAPIAGSVRIGGGTVNLNSKVGREVWVMSDKLTFGPDSMVAGEITYKGKREAVVQAGAQISAIDFQKIDRKGAKTLYKGFGFAGKLIWSIGLVIAGLLLLRFFPKKMNRVVEKTFDKPWANLGTGLVAAIVIPVVAVLLLLTVIGFYAGLMILAWLAILYLYLNIIAIVFFGAAILKKLNKYNGLKWTVLVTGAVVLLILKIIPFIGFLVCAILWLISFGAVLRLAREHLQTEEQSIT